MALNIGEVQFNNVTGGTITFGNVSNSTITATKTVNGTTESKSSSSMLITDFFNLNNVNGKNDNEQLFFRSIII